MPAAFRPAAPETDPIFSAQGATDVELAAAIAAHAAGDATDAELADAVAALEGSIAAKQDAATAATDAEVAAAIAAHNADTTDVHGIPDTEDIGGAVESVNGETGEVVLNAAHVGAQPSDADLDALAALTTTALGRSLLEKADAAAVRTAIAAASEADRAAAALNYQDGILVPNLLSGPVDVAASNTLGWVSRFVPPRDMAFTKYAFGLRANAGQDDTIDIGIYTVTNATTLARLFSTAPQTGRVNSGAAVVKEFALPATWNVSKGVVYYSAMVVSKGAGAAAQFAGLSGFGGLMDKFFSTTVSFPKLETGYAFPGNTLPATWNHGGGSGSHTPLLALRES